MDTINNDQTEPVCQALIRFQSGKVTGGNSGQETDKRRVTESALYSTRIVKSAEVQDVYSPRLISLQQLNARSYAT